MTRMTLVYTLADVPRAPGRVLGWLIPLMVSINEILASDTFW
ncbi:hypothetical protein [Arthrobacter sp. cf158]|nr:hypothetical protein [Arthrobacter sp. cf158]